MKKGFTFIELLIVMTIISALSALGMMKISAFQKQAIIDSVGNEIISVLKVARNKSQSGEVPQGMSLNDFTEDGLPSYGVKFEGDRYQVFVRYITKSDPTTVNKPSVDNPNLLSNDLTLTPSEVIFERISGKTVFNEIYVHYKAGICSIDCDRKVVIDSSGYFEIKEI